MLVVMYWVKNLNLYGIDFLLDARSGTGMTVEVGKSGMTVERV